MQVFELEHVVEHVPVELPRLAPQAEDALDLHQPGADVALGDTVQAAIELCGELGHRVVAVQLQALVLRARQVEQDRKSTRLNSSHLGISYADFCLKKK